MKREIIFIAVLALLLAGCGRTEDPYRVDTVVRIPVDPTEEPIDAPTVPEMTEPAATETEAPTEEPTTPPTEKPKTNAGGGGGYTGSYGGGGKGNSSQKETQPPATEPTTEPPTEPPTEPENKLYDISGYAPGGLEYAIAEQINAYRAEEGLGSLSFSSYLCAIASARGYEISQLWSHSRPDGRWCGSVLGDYGYGASTMTELLIYGTTDASGIVSRWMSADSTKEAILSESFTTVGIGVYYSGGAPYIACLLIG